MFAITQSKGFRVGFANGVEVSVQFGPGNYADNYSDDFAKPATQRWYKSETAEIAILVKGEKPLAVISTGERLIRHPSFEHDDVRGYCDAKTVLEIMQWAEALTAAEIKAL